MTHEDATKILAIITANYPNYYRRLTPEEARGVVTTWQIQFADVPVDVVLIALNKVMSTSEFPPTVAAIKKKFRNIYIEADLLLNGSEKLTDEHRAQCEHLKAALTNYQMKETEIRTIDIIKAYTGTTGIAAESNLLN